MPIITFWSNKKKETGQTLSLIALASYMAVENNSKILIIDTNPNNKTIEHAFFNEQVSSTRKAVEKLNQGKLDLTSGIEGVAKVISSGRTDEAIANYTKVVYKGRLEVMQSFYSKIQGEHERIKSVYPNLIKLANQQYDYVFVDLEKGRGDPITEEILKCSTVIAYTLTQRKWDLDDYIETKKDIQVFKPSKLLPLLGRYDRESKYTKKNMARAAGEKKDFPAIAYNTLFFEESNEAGIAPFFLKFRKNLLNVNNPNMLFISEMEKTADKLLLKVQESLMDR